MLTTYINFGALTSLTLTYQRNAAKLEGDFNAVEVAVANTRIDALSDIMEVLTFGLFAAFAVVALTKGFRKAEKAKGSRSVKEAVADLRDQGGVAFSDLRRKARTALSSSHSRTKASSASFNTPNPMHAPTVQMTVVNTTTAKTPTPPSSSV